MPNLMCDVLELSEQEASSRAGCAVMLEQSRGEAVKSKTKFEQQFALEAELEAIAVLGYN